MDKIQREELTLKELAQQLKLNFKGDAAYVLNGVASLTSATSTDLCFLQSKSYLKQLTDSQCGAVIVPEHWDIDIPDKALIFANHPQRAFVNAIHLLYPQDSIQCSVDPSAKIADSAHVADDVNIGANTIIGDRVRIEQGVKIGAGCIIEADCVIGAQSQLFPRVTLCHGVILGQQAIIHPGVVIGSDGFGLVYDDNQWIKIPHLGGVQIGDRVEIGANTTIDRGALDDTVIENGVKLDNLIQVAHNVRIGENTAIAACVGIAGSAIIGKNCKISGAAVVLGHLSVADDVTITAMSLVTKSITQSGTYSSGTPLMENRLWHRNNARYKKLDELAKSISSLKHKP
ncbi:MAG: UDP-3-O-(3-hydroxymyristoyl)glucosamine N-acyltransferase [Gammaproteobacteria bacterium]|nr:UDP-3-O-(3-hydroxymyristoyl)glucosamine N-acyltransferase [Gammaproteobacteria bacterium]